MDCSEKCAECLEPSVYYCVRCNENFCLRHVETHLDFSVCDRCGTDRCNELFPEKRLTGDKYKDDKLCFFCDTKLCIENMNENRNNIDDKSLADTVKRLNDSCQW